MRDRLHLVLRWLNPFSSEEVATRSGSFWNFDAPLPVPRNKLRCSCGSEEIIIKRWYFFLHPKSFKARCDIHTKCTFCSKVEIYGVAIPESFITKYGNRKAVYPKDLKCLS